MSTPGRVASTSKYGLETGKPGIKSIGPLAFGPDGILFAGDNVAATIFAVDTGDSDVAKEHSEINVENLDTSLATYLGCSKDDVFIRDMAVHPSLQNVYLSVMRGSGEVAIPVLVKVRAGGTLSEVLLEDGPFLRHQSRTHRPRMTPARKSIWSRATGRAR